MGVEYCHYLLPRPNSFLPSASQLATFIDHLFADHWLPSPDAPAFGKNADHVKAIAHISHQARKRHPLKFPLTPQVLEPLLQRNTRLTWEIVNPPALTLQYPLVPLDRWLKHYQSLDEIYYSVVFEWSPNYIHRTSECIEPDFPTQCACGTDLQFEGDDEEVVLGQTLFYNPFIHANCPQCGQAVDVSNWPANIRDGFTGEGANVFGGATSRFALLVDCGKGFPANSPMHLLPSLTALFRSTFQCDAYELGDFD